MATPQQPELARSRRSAAVPESTKARASSRRPDAPNDVHVVPDENAPGHHPPVEQDKPSTPPSLPARHRRFPFARDSLVARVSALFGVTNDERAYVDVDDERVHIRFGPWTITTPMTNVTGAERTGPYRWWKVIGPPHLSLRDRGVTFATSTSDGVCIRFRDPVPGALPNRFLRHPAATVTVEDPDDLVHFVNSAAG